MKQRGAPDLRMHTVPYNSLLLYTISRVATGIPTATGCGTGLAITGRASTGGRYGYLWMSDVSCVCSVTPVGTSPHGTLTLFDAYVCCMIEHSLSLSVNCLSTRGSHRCDLVSGHWLVLRDSEFVDCPKRKWLRSLSLSLTHTHTLTTAVSRLSVGRPYAPYLLSDALSSPSGHGHASRLARAARALCAQRRGVSSIL